VVKKKQREYCDGKAKQTIDGWIGSGNPWMDAVCMLLLPAACHIIITCGKEKAAPIDEPT
jgi:hypothetical protein